MATPLEIGLTIVKGYIVTIASEVTSLELTYTNSQGSCSLETNIGTATAAVLGINLTSTPSNNFQTLEISRSYGITYDNPVILGGFANSKIKTVSIYDVKLELQPKAFLNCQYLSSCNLTTSKMSMPTSLEDWPKWVFYGCVNLSSFNGADYLYGNIKPYRDSASAVKTILFMAPGAGSSVSISWTDNFVAIAPTACASCLKTILYWPSPVENVYYGEGCFYAASSVGIRSNSAGTLDFYERTAHIHSYAFEYVGWNTNQYYDITYGRQGVQGQDIFISSRAFARMKINNVTLWGSSKASKCISLIKDYAQNPSVSGQATTREQSWFYGCTLNSDCALYTETPLQGGLYDLFGNFLNYIDEYNAIPREEVPTYITLTLANPLGTMVDASSGATISTTPQFYTRIKVKINAAPSSSSDYDAEFYWNTTHNEVATEVNLLNQVNKLYAWWEMDSRSIDPSYPLPTTQRNGYAFQTSREQVVLSTQSGWENAVASSSLRVDDTIINVRLTGANET